MTSAVFGLCALFAMSTGGPEDPKVPARQRKDWEAAIGRLAPLDQTIEAFESWLWMLDPRPVDAFVRITSE